MTDYSLSDTIYQMFTTRAFATGIPTVLAGTPIVSAYENDSVTQITAGITLGVSHDGVVGMNLLTIVATGANGFEAGKDYNLVITTGTVGSVSVVGEVVGTFSIERSAAVSDIAALNDVAATDIVSAGAITTLAGAIVNVDLVDTTTTNTDMRGTDSAFLAASAPTNFSSMVISGAGAVDALTQGYLNTLLTEATAGRIAGNFDIFFENADAVTTQVVDDVGGGAGGTDWSAAERNEIRGRLGITGTTAAGGNPPTLSLQSSIDALNDFNPASDAVANVTLVATTTTNTDMRGTDSALLAASAPTNFGDLAITVTTGQVTVGTNNDKSGYAISGTITTLDGLNNFNPSTDAIANVTLVATTTSNTDMRGTDSAATAAALATVDANVDAIKLTTDKFVFTIAGVVDCNIQRVNDVTVNGTGAAGNEWGP